MVIFTGDEVEIEIEIIEIAHPEIEMIEMDEMKEDVLDHIAEVTEIVDPILGTDIIEDQSHVKMIVQIIREKENWLIIKFELKKNIFSYCFYIFKSVQIYF